MTYVIQPVRSGLLWRNSGLTLFCTPAVMCVAGNELKMARTGDETAFYSKHYLPFRNTMQA